MDKLRIHFEKTGRAVYISHLDLMRTMQRAFLRSQLPLKYSEGFNPHAQLTFALPLSVGTASSCELMDFSLREYTEPSEICFRLNRSLPEGIYIKDVYPAERKFKDIKWLEIDGEFEYDSGCSDWLLSRLCEFFAEESIVITRKTKSGEGQADIAPSLCSICFDGGKNTVSLNALISAQEPTLNPEHIISALRQLAPELCPDFAHFRRKQLFDIEMLPFK